MKILAWFVLIALALLLVGSMVWSMGWKPALAILGGSIVITALLMWAIMEVMK